MGKLYVSLQLYIVGLYLRYMRRHISYHGNAQGTQKRPLNFSFCKLSETNSETYHFYLFVGKIPKLFNFLNSKEKSYLVELNIFNENEFYSLQKIVLDNFPRNFYV